MLRHIGVRAAVLIGTLNLIAGLPTPAHAEDHIPFDDELWDLGGAQVVEHLGRRALVGVAVLEDVELTSGVIEVDVAVSGARSYPGVLFRVQSDGEYERVYLRPHRAGLYPDALQYTPVFHGVATWQLHHGPGNTASAVFPENEWFTLRIEFSGSQARVLVGDGSEARLDIRHLRHQPGPGGLGLMGPADGSAYFSRFRYSASTDIEFEPVPEVVTPPGTLSAWEVSQAMPAAEVSQVGYPRFYGVFLADWRTVEAEPEGLVNLSRLAASSRSRPMTVWARTTVHSTTREDVRLSIGYSDDVAVFVNRRPVFSGRSGYRSRDPSFVGVVGLSETVTVRLEPGLNEIFLIVTDAFGGWGFRVEADRELEPARTTDVPPVRVWDTGEIFATPESVLLDRERDVLYVSNFDKIDTRRMDTGFISRLSLDGEVLDREWVTGLDGPCGMAILGERLFVVESFKGTLVEIDIATGAIVDRHDVPEGHAFLNDLAVDRDGRLYLSDTSRDWAAADIYRFEDGAVETWIEGYDLHRSNGLLVDEDRLVVGSVGEGLLKSLDLESRRMETIAALGAGVIDGIRADGRGGYLVSHWEGKIFRVTAVGEVVELLDLRHEGLNTADFELVAERDLIVIPTFMGDSVVAYRLMD